MKHITVFIDGKPHIVQHHVTVVVTHDAYSWSSDDFLFTYTRTGEVHECIVNRGTERRHLPLNYDDIFQRIYFQENSPS